MKKWADERGSIIVEAAMMMPLFLTLMIAMVSFIQIAVAEMALQHAVSETTKQVAAHMYPAYLLSQTKRGDQMAEVLQDIDAVKEEFGSISTFSDDYAALIPEPVVQLLSLDTRPGDVGELLKNTLVLQLLNVYVDERLLNKQQLKVTASHLPNVFDKQQAYFGITAQYELNLFIPFIRQTLTLSKTAYERVWIGD